MELGDEEIPNKLLIDLFIHKINATYPKLTSSEFVKEYFEMEDDDFLEKGKKPPEKKMKKYSSFEE